MRYSICILAGNTQQFTCTANYSDSSTVDCTSSATWNSSSTSVATVDTGGMVSAIGAGSSTITATVSGFTGTAVITVIPPPPSSSFQGISGWQGVVIR